MSMTFLCSKTSTKKEVKKIPDGELKKKIERVLAKEMHYWDQQTALLKIVNKAKIDFPFGVVTISDDKGNEYPMNVYPKEDIDKWRIKWFGV